MWGQGQADGHAPTMFIHSARAPRVVHLPLVCEQLTRTRAELPLQLQYTAMDRHSATLCCAELPTTTQQRRPHPDRALDRRRVMENLLNSEDRVLANPRYLEVVQCSQMTESMRRQLVEWMLEVSYSSVVDFVVATDATHRLIASVDASFALPQPNDRKN